jgi:hypothetical protein
MELDVFTAARAASMDTSRGYERKKDNQMIVKRLALPTLNKTCFRVIIHLSNGKVVI